MTKLISFCPAQQPDNNWPPHNSSSVPVLLSNLQTTAIPDREEESWRVGNTGCGHNALIVRVIWLITGLW